MTDYKWIINFILPIGLMIYGALYKYKDLKKTSVFLGYKTTRALLSQETWEYANKRVGNIWINLGALYTIFVGLYLLLAPSAREKLSLVVFAVGVAIILYTFFTVDKELEEKFDVEGKAK